MPNSPITIQILCEGYEEKAYIDKILSMPTIRKDIYSFFPTINCKSLSKIFPRFQDVFSQNYANIILIFCDADKCSSEYKELQSKIDNCMFGGNEVSRRIVIFGNPVTLQIVLSHFSCVSLSSCAKAKNQQIVEDLTGIKNYQAHDDQIKQMMSMINFSNFKIMKKNLKLISKNVCDIPSTNFIDFLNYIESQDTKWCSEIYELMKGGD